MLDERKVACPLLVQEGMSPRERPDPEPMEHRPSLEDIRTLARKSLRHRDLDGLAELMDDYLALADDLEVVTGSESRMKVARANDGNTEPAPPASSRAA